MRRTDAEIAAALVQSQGSVQGAAKALGMARSSLRHRIGAMKALPSPTVIQNDMASQLKDAERKIREIEKDNLTAAHVRQYLFGLSRAEATFPRWINDRKRYPYQHGVPVLFLSDLHHGEVVFAEQVFGANAFDSKISERRIKTVVDTSLHLAHEVLREPKFPGCVLVLGGDNINGDIHEELQIGSDKRIMAQTIEIADILHSCILKLLDRYDFVTVVGVSGNHGRSTRKPLAKFYAETNFDWLVYQMLERFLLTHVKSGRLHFETPAARDVTVKIAGRRFRISHGDQFRGGDGIIGALGPVTRGDNKKRTMAQTLPTDAELYDTLMVGHFHTLYQNQTLIMNGSTKGYDEYALANNFKFEPPQQAFFLVHSKYGINHFMPILADDAPEIQSKKFVEVLR